MKKHYFISDLHLGAAYINNPRSHEARVIAFLDAIKHILFTGKNRFTARIFLAADNNYQAWIGANHCIGNRVAFGTANVFTIITTTVFITVNLTSFYMEIVN